MADLTVEQAKVLIDSIRAEQLASIPGGIKDNVLAQALARGLDLISDQLYSGPTHFIQELIRNADDNAYPDGILPTLTFIQGTNGYLSVGCSECGFTEANVRAICTIADSTKKVDADRKVSIGEKGIGFKAVFKVATAVWVRSGSLSFKFDKSNVLGMMVPEWATCPVEGRLTDRTVFCLYIPSADDRAFVKKQLIALDSGLLLFLRNVRKIQIGEVQADGTSKILRTIMREDCVHSKIETRVLETRSEMPSVSRYFRVFGTTATDMPSDDKRPGIRKTDVFVALPTAGSNNHEPVIQSQKLHNFLPVRAYGLSFIVNADFIVNASREEIEKHNAWNLRLVETAKELFLNTINVLKHQPDVKWTWPRYLQSHGTADDTIMATFLDDIGNNLREIPSLWSEQGELKPPSQLYVCPKYFTTGKENKESLFRPVGDLFASLEYLPEDLVHLNVDVMSALLIAYLLQRLDADFFKQQSSVWHSRLAHAVTTNIGSHEFRNTALIPLRGGEWVSSKSGQVYFSETAGGVPVANDVNVRIIDDAAATDPARSTMFRELGVLQLSPNEVCRLIANHHNRMANGMSTMSNAETIIEQTWYAFSHGSPADDFSDLCIAWKTPGSVGSVVRYIEDVEGDFSINKYVPTDGSVCGFVSPLYLAHGDHRLKSKWLKWLKANLKFRTVPRIQGPSGTISKELRYIVDNHTSDVWLSILMDFHAQLKPTPPGIHGFEGTISSQLVLCNPSRSSVPLHSTYLPTTAVVEEALATKFLLLLRVDQPNDRKWQNLTTFGVGVSPNLGFYIDILRALRLGRDDHNQVMEHLRRIYEKIETLFGEDVESAR
ncbi:hypothetical protein LTR27_008750 [Elasticomyces elasticus]|nr:hypothetical protein LTR27_008750 [Elasticomyces elasticus]